MKKIVWVLIMSITVANAFSQNENIHIAVGRSFHGTGDFRGISFSTNYERFFKNKAFSGTYSFGGTIHDGDFPIYYNYPAGETTDGSIRYTTAGLQIGYYLGYNFIKKVDCAKLQFKIGGIARYQTSSYYDDVAVLYGALTNIPFPVVVIRNFTPSRTYAVGLNPQISFSHIAGKKYFFGIKGDFQFDTNEDNIASLSLMIGRNL